MDVSVLHAPALHTWKVPQEVPSASAVCEQVGTFAEQVTDPVWHASLPGHDTPGVQVQVPALHARYVPQLVASGTGVPASVQTGAPGLLGSSQEMTCVWHGLR